MKPLFRTGLTKLPKHKSFEYRPRYYDERKERLEKREQEIRNRLEADEKDSEREKIEFNFRRDNSHTHRSKELMRSNIRLILIMFGLIAIFYYLFFKTDVFSQLISK